jgi:glycosyltransferase involved in cell wall biosynthesis
MLIERYYPHVAGAERQIQARIPPLTRRRVGVVVATRRERGLPASELVSGTPVHRLPASGSRVAASLRFTLASLTFLAARRDRVNVIHAYSLFSPTTTAALAKLLLGTPVVVELLGGGSVGDLAVLRSVRSGPLRLWLLPRFVDAFIALSREIEQGLRAIGVPEQRIFRIPNGVDSEHFCPADAERRRALRSELDLDGRRVAIFVGRLAPEKGLDDLLEAWPAVRHALPNALLLVVGDGVQRTALQARAAPDVRFVGSVEDPAPYLQAADCFVLPSRSEGLPVALLEAMATGLPCVATAIGGIVDVLRHEVEGWLVPPGDVAALGAALIHALESPDRDRIGAAGRARVIGDFSLEGVAEQFADLYRRLIRIGSAP